jgi:ABC-type transport system involved in cytochrome c biogenesis permease subunit
MGDGTRKEKVDSGATLIAGLGPVVVAVSAAGILALVRLKFSVLSEISDAALLMISLASYILAAALLLTELKVSSPNFRRMVSATLSFGVFANLSSWFFRWILSYERELGIFIAEGRDLTAMPWMLRYIPFANLYDMSIAFAFGAGLTSLILLGRNTHRIISAFTLPLTVLVMTLARFIGDDFVDLPPVLDSVWRPIHVGTAAISYGTALVCFVVAILYLIKDGINRQWLILWASFFGSAVLLFIGEMHLLTNPLSGVYPMGLSDSISGDVYRLRADLAGIGWLHLGAFLAFLLSAVVATLELTGKDPMKGRLTIPSASVGAVLTLLLFILMFASTGHPVRNSVEINQRSLSEYGRFLAESGDVLRQDAARMSDSQIMQNVVAWVDERRDRLEPSMKANPVENAALVTVIFLGLFAVIVNARQETFKRILPPSDDLDELTYKLGAFTFVGLGVLLATGAVWANESWGRYWGWDAKEVGALCAWLTYAVFLHTRITRGWQGRRSAYFAVLAFLFVIFTYLGVSYLLPGLHSYA